MTNDNKKTKNNAPCEERQETRELTEKELAQVSGGWGRQGPAAVPQSVIYNQIAGEYGNVKR